MIPLYSNRPLSGFPFITIALVIANIAVFWHELTFPGGIDLAVRVYGMIPSNWFNPLGIEEKIPVLATFFTSMFFHGDFMHIGTNMLYLWVFGRNVEDDFGHFRFLVFYIFTGVIATLAYAWAFRSSSIPLVGASGAIAGVLGAYFLRFPGSRIYTAFIFIIFIKVIPIPAFFLLGIWFAIQIWSSLGSYTPEAFTTGGIAWIAHVAGFVTGLIWTIWELGRRYRSRRFSSG
jgi:membrane associated rhomboid family serine protease